MIRINLLPEEFHVRRKKLHVSPRASFFVAAFVGLCAVVFLLTLWQGTRLRSLDEAIRKTRMEAERQRADLALVEELTALKERILERMQVVEQLNQNRTRWIDIMTDLSASMPEEMWLTSFKEEQTGNSGQARIQGMTFSLKPIALFMDQLEVSGWFQQPQFTYAQRLPVDEGMAYDFEIRAALSAPRKPHLSGETAGGAESAAGDGKKR
jgi:type IV pilus assembly protein PilN